jgi:hypothetical protein
MKTLARERDRDEILRRLRHLRPDSVRRWGKMSAPQMVCHLSDSFRIVTGQMTASPASGPLQRTVVKWIALYVPLPWPGGIQTRPEIDQLLDAGTRPGDFATNVAELEAMTVRFATDRMGCARHPHPIFGTMSERAWMRWGYLHMDHHLRQFGA